MAKPVAVVDPSHVRSTFIVCLGIGGARERNDVPGPIFRQVVRDDFAALLLHMETQEARRRANIKHALALEVMVSKVLPNTRPQIHSPVTVPCPGMSME